MKVRCVGGKLKTNAALREKNKQKSLDRCKLEKVQEAEDDDKEEGEEGKNLYGYDA